MRNVGKIWARLEADDTRSSGYVTLRLEPDSNSEIFAAVEKPHNLPALMLEIPVASLPAGFRAPRSRGFEVLIEAVTPGPQGIARIILKVNDRRYLDVFAVLVEDIVAHVLAKSTVREKVDALIARLERWRVFWRLHGDSGLRREEQLGLYGELWFLFNKVFDNTDARSAVKSWVGPRGQNQDFNFDRCAVETKASIQSPHQTIRISNVRQLDDAGVAALVLFYLMLEARSVGNESLPDLVHCVRERLQDDDEVALSEFNDRLIEAGYLDIHEAQYEETKYTMHKAHYFLVREGFPRILERDHAVGIGDVRYSLAVSACMPFKIAESEALGYLAEDTSE